MPTWLEALTVDSGMTVKDDGIGIHLDKLWDTDMGLHIMKYRADMIGGNLSTRPGSPGSTVVTCIIENARGKRGSREGQRATGKGRRETTGSHRR